MGGMPQIKHRRLAGTSATQTAPTDHQNSHAWTFSSVFVKNDDYTPPLPTEPEKLQTRTTDVDARTDGDILQMCDRKLTISLTLFEPAEYYYLS